MKRNLKIWVFLLLINTIALPVFGQEVDSPQSEHIYPTILSYNEMKKSAEELADIVISLPDKNYPIIITFDNKFGFNYNRYISIKNRIAKINSEFEDFKSDADGLIEEANKFYQIEDSTADKKYGAEVVGLWTNIADKLIGETVVDDVKVVLLNDDLEFQIIKALKSKTKNRIIVSKITSTLLKTKKNKAIEWMDQIKSKKIECAKYKAQLKERSEKLDTKNKKELIAKIKDEMNTADNLIKRYELVNEMITTNNPLTNKPFYATIAENFEAFECMNSKDVYILYLNLISTGGSVKKYSGLFNGGSYSYSGSVLGRCIIWNKNGEILKMINFCSSTDYKLLNNINFKQFND